MHNDDLQALLVRRALLTPDQVEWAVLTARGTNRTWLEEVLLVGLVDEALLCQCVSSELHVPFCRFDVLSAIGDDVLQLLPAEVAAEHRVLPLSVEPDGDLHVAMVDPSDRTALEEIHFFAGRRLVREVAVATAIAWALHHYHGVATALWPRHRRQPSMIGDASRVDPTRRMPRTA